MNRQEKHNRNQRWQGAANQFNLVVHSIMKRMAIKHRYQFAEQQLGLNASTFSNYCEGRHAPKDEIIEKVVCLAVEHDVDAHMFVNVWEGNVALVNPGELNGTAKFSVGYISDLPEQEEGTVAKVSDPITFGQGQPSQFSAEDVAAPYKAQRTQVLSAYLKDIENAQTELLNAMKNIAVYFSAELLSIQQSFVTPVSPVEPIQLELPINPEPINQEDLMSLNRSLLDEKVKSLAMRITEDTQKRHPQMSKLGESLTAHYCKQLNTDIYKLVKKTRENFNQDDFFAAHNLIDQKRERLAK